jgi:predicted AAA+ superfamily ATPase
VDVKGKEIIMFNEKFYVTDLGLRNALLGKPATLYLPKILENIVYNELIFRDYSVAIGKINRQEIDFIAIKNNRDIYIQIALNVDSIEKRNQELLPLKSIKNNNKKFLITLDKTILNSNEDGVIFLDIISFLNTDLEKLF